MVLSQLQSLQEDLLAEIGRSVAIASVQEAEEEGAPFGRPVRQALDHALDLSRRLGFRAVNVGDMAGYAEYGEGPEMVAVLGHLDVVPAGEGWTRDPFGMTREGNRFYGRGVLDNKGPILTALFALKAVVEAGWPLRRRVRILFGCNEESGCRCMERYVRTEELPVAGFTPDGAYPIINAEKGMINAFCEAPFGGDGPLSVVSLKGGTAPNIVPSRAEALLCGGAALLDEVLDVVRRWKGPEGSSVEALSREEGLLLVAKGLPAHGSMPEKGVNAIACLFDLLGGLPLSGEQESLVEAFNALIGRETDGASLGLALSDALSGALTVNVGTALAGGGKIAFVLNIRFPVTFAAPDVVASLGKGLSKGGIALASEFHHDPLYVSPQSELIGKLQKVYLEITHREPTLLAIGGGTYAKSMPNVVAFGPVFPGQEFKVHEADEYWTVDDMMVNARIMAHAIIELAR
ncbi:Sapep family Mn(2+)-dependent dipeptidase [Aminirod propionatiphilus]|uniref:Sapep family Mn(2+)-dependent dipeptidase n=1 Tax=Aminirod propionatiphilus TaxID=3415223 RepID=A0ACD1DUL3_9BACT|nr:Sapep family Mn(2+)-dependent dipeptidase [Synergistota bacterium]